MDGKKDARKMIFTPLKKQEHQILRTMKCWKKSKMLVENDWKMLAAIGTGVVKVSEPKILKEFDGCLEIT